MTHEQRQPSDDTPPLMGLATLMRMAYGGDDLGQLANRLLDRAQRDPGDASAMLDLATTLELCFKPELAAEIQAQALQAQTLYHLPSARPTALRLLAIMAPGDISSNAPLPFLLEESDVALDLLFVGPGLPAVAELPDHDVLFIAISESDPNRPLLEELQPVIDTWPRPVLNQPARILRTSRDGAYALLHDAPGVVMPPSLRLERATLERIAHGELPLSAAVTGFDFPLIVRPVGSHAGHGLERLTCADELVGYLAANPDPLFYLSPFIDYRGEDGLFRKYRVVLIQGHPYAGHMAISSHWMIHYLNAGMGESADKRAEEARFMAGFDEEFARRHATALAAIHQRVGLDYLVIDCAETAQGELLVFEVDTGAVIHAMDPPELFPYKVPAMRKVFDAFRALLGATAAGQTG